MQVLLRAWSLLVSQLLMHGQDRVKPRSGGPLKQEMRL